MQKTEINELLTKAKELLKSEVTEISYRTWIKDFEIEDIRDKTIIILTQNNMHKNMKNLDICLLSKILLIFLQI